MKRGQGLLELIIAMALFSLFITGISTLISTNQFLLENGALTIQALARAELALGATEAQLRNNFWGNFVATSTSDGPFEISSGQNFFDNFTKISTTTVRWREGSREEKVELLQLISDPAEAYGESDCRLSGNENWQSLQVFNGPNLGLGNEANGIFTRNGIVYLAVDNTNPRDPTTDKNTFFIIDSTDPNYPSIISKLNTGPGLNSVVAVGNYAYLGNTSINAQLQVVDISNPTSPRIVANYKLPGTYNDGTTIANTLFYHRGRIYLGTAKSQIEEFHIIDVENPLSPHEIGKWEVNAGINSIYVASHYAFIASPLSGQELIILDIADPAHLRKVAWFSAPGGSGLGAGHGKSLVRDRSTIYLGRTVGQTELFALNIDNFENPINIGSFVVGDSVNALGGAVNRLFLGTNHKFEILNTANTAHINLIHAVNMPAKITGLSCSGKTIFLSLLQNDGLRIILPAP